MIVDIMTIQSQLVSILIIIQRKGLRMSANSPFSRYYRNFIDQNQAKRQIQSAPRAAIQELPTQATNNHRDFNIFDALLDKEERVERPKIQPKIKVFGLGLRKSKKDQQKSDFLKRGQDEFKNQVQNSHNLLSSLESLPENYYQKECVSGVQNESPEQLRKLLQLESGGHEQEEKEDINSEQQINEIETPLKLTESEDIEFKLPKKSEEIQLFLNKVPMTINKQEESRKLNLIEKTESCEIPPMGVVGEHPSNKQIEGRSMNSSKIRSIFDHCSELFGQNFEIPEQCQSVENPITNEVEESQIITERESRNSKANSDSPLSPNSHLKVQNNNNNYKLSTVSGQVMKSSKTPKTPTRVDVPITRKFAKPPLIKTKKEVNERSNVFIEQSSSVSKNKRGIELKKYLSLDSHYNYQVDKLINRYEKVSALEQKKRQIKEQLQKLAPKKSQTNINRFDKNYYLPVNKFPSHEQNFDYFYGDPQPQKQSALFASAPPTKRQKLVHQVDCDKTSPPVEYQNDLQKQLNKNVENMEKIINKFKLLSKQISNQSQDYIHSQYLQQANSNLRQAEINIKKIEVDQSSELESSNAYVKQLNRHFFSTTESPKDIKQISSRFQVQHPGGSDSIIDSVQQISLSKELAGATQRINPNFQSSKPTETGKQTARTEKTGMTRRRKHPSAQQRYSSHHCLEDHQYLTEQLSRLNSKIEQLEKRERSHLQQLKSEEKMKNAMDLPKNNLKVKLDQHSVESDYQEEADQSIPILETVRYQDLYQEKKQKKISVQYPVKGILKEKSGLKINQKVIKKMKLKFPILEKFPSRQDSLATLVSLGQYTLSILLKFVKNRIHIDSKKLKIEGNLKVKKFIDCIHYSIPHFEYNLIFYFSGKLYFGHWNKQLVNGQGYKHGFGYYLKPKKYIYEGEFQLNKKHGKGLLNTFKGQIYDGDWMKGKKCGYGTLINQTGDIYQGFFEDGKKCGTGEEQLANGDYYRGEFKKGKLNGSGVYIWVDGSIYKGEFKNGLLNGHGIWRSKDNDCYQGQYKDNKKHGKGTYTWSNGQCFTGEFYQDQNIAKRPSFTNFSKKQSLNSPRPRNNEQIRSGRKSKGKRK